jgi:5-methylcytosine-specific restriction endonuclease McrA
VGQVLVLDVGYQAVQRTEWQTAIVWVLDRVAEVVAEDPDRYIRTVNWSVKMPSVVRLIKPINRKRAIKFSRHAIYQRDKGRCQYCGTHVSRDRFTYDHVVPRSQGGVTSWLNVCCSCTTCNQRKAGRTPEQASMRLLSMPVRPKSLPNARREIEFTPGMPEAWRDYLRSSTYWNVELESDE